MLAPRADDNKLSSAESRVESTPSALTRQQQQQQQPSSDADRGTSISQQPSSELEPTKAADEHAQSDSLVDIVRQIGTIPHLARLPLADNRPQDADTPSADYHVDIIETNESIPHQPVTFREHEDASPSDASQQAAQGLITTTSEGKQALAEASNENSTEEYLKTPRENKQEAVE